MRSEQIAIQLYTLRALLAEDLPGTIRAVKEAGYRSVELAGLPAIAPQALRGLLDASELRALAAHESLESLREDLDGALTRATLLGCDRVIVPAVVEAERSTVEGVRQIAAELGRLGTACEERGVRLGYHNHDVEFAPLEGTTMWDVLLAEIGPAVDLELDVYWATVGGRDPVDLIRSAGDRIRLIHMKDRAAGPDGLDVTPGDGVLDWPLIVDAATDRGIEWYIVEEDNPRDAIAEIARGREFLEGLASA